ncbi:hypothetical protein PDIDSM_4605 [Penicillium digitatum]|nr:hypothetical protein PDIDSM_4605 [Penicillium digitatum]
MERRAPSGLGVVTSTQHSHADTMVSCRPMAKTLAAPRCCHATSLWARDKAEYKEGEVDGGPLAHWPMNEIPGAVARRIVIGNTLVGAELEVRGRGDRVGVVDRRFGSIGLAHMRLRPVARVSWSREHFGAGGYAAMKSISSSPEAWSASGHTGGTPCGLASVHYGVGVPGCLPVAGVDVRRDLPKSGARLPAVSCWVVR